MQYREHQEQCAIFDWAKVMSGRHPQLKFMYAVPNAGSRTPAQAARALREGLKTGVPDIVLPCARRGFHGLYIELKVGYNKPTEKQKEYIEYLESEGYHATWAKGSEAAIQIIEWYLNVEDWLVPQ